MIGRPIQPHPEPEEIDLDVATALKRLADEGAVDDMVRVPPTVSLRLVARLRSAGLVETAGCPTGAVQAVFTPQGKRILQRAIERTAQGPSR